jgi:hypothetical protein
MVRAAEVRETSSNEDAASRPVTLLRPEGRDGRFDCPRCTARLLFDGEKLACLMCGYEHSATRLRGGPRSPGELLDALPLLRSDLIGHVDSLGAEPEAGSPAHAEFGDASAAELTALQFGRLFAQQCLVSAGHSLIALARGLEPPAPEYGTWSIARAVLNSTSLVTWLLDPELTRGERAGRALAVQIDDLEAECQFLTTLLTHRGERGDGFTESLSANRARRQEMLALATDLGGVVPVPEATERAACLDASFEYLMCSSIRDGRPWALLHATAMQSPGYEMDRAGSILATQVQLSARWYAQATWDYVQWMSQDSLDELQSSLEFGYDSLALADDDALRFWRRQPTHRSPAAALAS